MAINEGDFPKLNLWGNSVADLCSGDSYNAHNLEFIERSSVQPNFELKFAPMKTRSPVKCCFDSNIDNLSLSVPILVILKVVTQKPIHFINVLNFDSD